MKYEKIIPWAALPFIFFMILTTIFIFPIVPTWVFTISFVCCALSYFFFIYVVVKMGTSN